MAKLLPPDEIRLLVKVSKLYYEDSLTQDEIVEKLQLSRSKISRLLQRARDEGIVQITVLTPPGILPDLETRLETHFHLQEAVVVEVHPSVSPNNPSRQLGAAAAAYLARSLHDNDQIGISWGSTLNHMVTAAQPIEARNTHIVQIIGGLGPPEAEVHATDLCHRLARTLGARLTLLPTPGIVDHQQTRAAFLSDSHVRRAMDLFSHLNVAFVGIGAPTPDSVVMNDGSIITPPELADLLGRGAVGDIALRFFDACGAPVESDVNARVIGITLDQLAHIKRVVGVAGGAGKIQAILGALRGGLIDVLITDSLTAAQLLEFAPATST